MSPNSWASGTSTARSIVWRTVCSILGRSCVMMASMRCSRVSLRAAEGEGVDMVQLRVGRKGVILYRLPAYHADAPISHPSNSCTPNELFPMKNSLDGKLLNVHNQWSLARDTFYLAAPETRRSRALVHLPPEYTRVSFWGNVTP